MTALSNDNPVQWRDPNYLPYPVSATEVIYKGALVAIDGDGYLVPAADTAGLTVVGVAAEKVDNTNGADGAVSCEVVSGKTFKMTAASIAITMVGGLLYVVDDATIDDAAGPTNDIIAGVLTEFVSATEGWLYIPNGGCVGYVDTIA